MTLGGCILFRTSRPLRWGIQLKKNLGVPSLGLFRERPVHIDRSMSLGLYSLRIQLQCLIDPADPITHAGFHS